MLSSLKDMLQLLGFSVFEVWLQVTALIVFLVLLCLKVEGDVVCSWAHVLIPLFVADALCAYFSLIVFVRSLNCGMRKGAYKRITWVAICLFLLVLFKVLLVKMLDQKMLSSPSSVITAPVFTLMLLYFGRSCKV